VTGTAGHLLTRKEHPVIPEDLYYSEEHEWVRLDDDVATIGITDYAQEQLGDIVYVDLPQVGDSLESGTVIGELESTKSVSDVFSPISGEVMARNEALDGGAEIINSDPYGEGWLIKVRPSDEDATAALLSPEAYGALVSE
jgi:glycine cleavage system H protein